MNDGKSNAPRLCGRNLPSGAGEALEPVEVREAQAAVGVGGDEAAVLKRLQDGREGVYWKAQQLRDKAAGEQVQVSKSGTAVGSRPS
jgi:hypothetical protein